MQFNYFKEMRNLTLLAPASLFFTIYAKAMLHSYYEHQEHLKCKEDLKKQGFKISETTVYERFKKAYIPIFPLVSENLPKEDVPKYKK
jgi:hypothetical protein